MLKKALLNNQKRIDEVIREDSFPDSVQPAFLKEAVRDYPLRGGKRIRSAMLNWVCGLISEESERSLFAAAAVEIYHNWTLVHDDIIDQDDLRRGIAATHIKLSNTAMGYTSDIKLQSKFGIDFAILAGDIQQAWAINMLLRSTELGVSPLTVLALARELQIKVNKELVSGEGLDVKFSYQNWDEVSVDEIEEMLRLKTGALLSYSAQVGAMIALDSDNINNNQIQAVSDYAMKAGIAFQLRDDWLGIFADEKKLGKPIASDISEGKPVILIKDAVNSLKMQDKEELQSYIYKQNLSSNELDRIKYLIKLSGAEERITQKAETLIKEAKDALNIFKDNKYKKLLFQLADYMLEREF
jgi:geranylgeranyl diphosphate synthase type I